MGVAKAGGSHWQKFNVLVEKMFSRAAMFSFGCCFQSTQKLIKHVFVSIHFLYDWQVSFCRVNFGVTFLGGNHHQKKLVCGCCCGRTGDWSFVSRTYPRPCREFRRDRRRRQREWGAARWDVVVRKLLASSFDCNVRIDTFGFFHFQTFNDAVCCLASCFVANSKWFIVVLW